MKIKQLYTYKRADGGTTVTPNKPEGVAYTTNAYRIIADEGKAVTKDGVNLYACIDTDTTEGWYEVDAPEESEG